MHCWGIIQKEHNHLQKSAWLCDFNMLTQCCVVCNGMVEELKSIQPIHQWLRNSMLLQPFLELRFQCALLVNTQKIWAHTLLCTDLKPATGMQSAPAIYSFCLFSMLSPFPTVLSGDRGLPDNFLNINNTSLSWLQCFPKSGSCWKDLLDWIPVCQNPHQPSYLHIDGIQVEFCIAYLQMCWLTLV